MADAQNLLESMGGLEALRPVISDFIDRVRADVMIGFHFNGVDPDVLKQRELEFTARALGADIPYSGRGMRQAHAPHPILSGQFYRRLMILRLTLADHVVPQPVIDAVVAHTERLHDMIVRMPEGCLPPKRPTERP